MKATSLLAQQHLSMKTALRQMAGPRSDLGRLLNSLAHQLAAHVEAEEEIFYPAIRHVAPNFITGCCEAHFLAQLALTRLLAAQRDNAFERRLAVATELIERHIDEEEHVLFSEAERQLGEAKLVELGTEIALLVEQIFEDAFETPLSSGAEEILDDVLAGEPP